THKQAIFQLLGLPRGEGRGRGGGDQGRVLVDTSAIIDGRIADICQTGFISGPLVVPRFVLEELQRVADSSDTLRRNRGRRGLDILSRLQKNPSTPLEIVDLDVGDAADVDAKLIRLARQLRCPIVTNDYNLNRVAALQGVKVLNINELANAVKAVLLPGEEMVVRVIQEGKEPGQGVGYLDDGTMVVVENGRRFLNSEVEVVVSRVLQTVAGRMIFAYPKVQGEGGHGRS
ncbi:MAG TPA: PIN domain-containing protein, partial [Chloroflexota bacterium]